MWSKKEKKNYMRMKIEDLEQDEFSFSSHHDCVNFKKMLFLV